MECDKIFALLEKKAMEAMVPAIPSAEIVHPSRVNRVKKNNNRACHTHQRSNFPYIVSAQQLTLPCQQPVKNILFDKQSSESDRNIIY